MVTGFLDFASLGMVLFLRQNKLSVCAGAPVDGEMNVVVDILSKSRLGWGDFQQSPPQVVNALIDDLC
ncbi:hypothetical protein PJM46_29620, partial [Mycobacterium kansasii]